MWKAYICNVPSIVLLHNSTCTSTSLCWSWELNSSAKSSKSVLTSTFSEPSETPSTRRQQFVTTSYKMRDVSSAVGRKKRLPISQPETLKQYLRQTWKMLARNPPSIPYRQVRPCCAKTGKTCLRACRIGTNMYMLYRRYPCYARPTQEETTWQ